MDPIKFEQCNCVYAEKQAAYLPLPAHKNKDGIVTSCWQLSLKEKLQLLLSGKIFIQTLTFNTPLQPIKVSTSKPEL